MSEDRSISKWRLSEILIPMLITDHWHFIAGSIIKYMGNKIRTVGDVCGQNISHVVKNT